MKRPAETHAAFDGLVGRIATFVERARSRGIPVLFVQHDGQPGHRLERGLPGWQIRRELAPIRDEPVIPKTACDAFFKTTLESELASRNIQPADRRGLHDSVLRRHIGAPGRQPWLRCDFSGRWTLNGRHRVPHVRSDRCSSQRTPGWLRCGGALGARRALRPDFVVVCLAFVGAYAARFWNGVSLR